MSDLTIEILGAILHIRLTRPQKLNALTPDMYTDMANAYGQLNRDNKLRVAVLSAEGDHFTSGLELDKWGDVFAGGSPWPMDEDGIDPFGLRGPFHSKPVVMAAQGYCFTWGVEQMLNTEVRVVANNTLFQMLEVQRGLFPCGGATMRLQRDIGWSHAQRYLLTGDRWTADQAMAWGMVQELTPVGGQLERAMEIAERIAAAAPLAVQASLAASRQALEADRETAVQYINTHFRDIAQTEDAREGVLSFVERRKAVFHGR